MDCVDVVLEGALDVPRDAIGLVVFAHGSGSSRFSPRNRAVAKYFGDHNLANLLFDLLTEDEEREDLLTRRLRFDIDFLARRVVAVTDWLDEQSLPGKLPLGYFGSSTGAAAALVAASQRADRVAAVVSRGGRPDLAASALTRVRAPTLLVVGGRDMEVLELNRIALRQLRCDKKLVTVPGATHLFEEPGTLEQVMRVAERWFARVLVAARHGPDAVQKAG